VQYPTKSLQGLGLTRLLVGLWRLGGYRLGSGLGVVSSPVSRVVAF
jgi:hypothetical protein